jgi:hypothetical protein
MEISMDTHSDFQFSFGDDEAVDPHGGEGAFLGDIPQVADTKAQMYQKFLDFDAENPKIWDMFCLFSQQLIHAGWDRYSADAILHRVRWETAVRGVNDQFKINNNYSAFYARKFREHYPEYEEFFETRKSKADRQSQ